MTDPFREKLFQAHLQLIHQRLIAPVHGSDPSQVALWQGCDLALTVEGAFQVRVDPRTWTAEERAGWVERLGHRYHMPSFSVEDRAAYNHRYFLLDKGQPAGSIALGVMVLGECTVPVQDLYVLPPHRGRGIATRALRAFYEAVVAQGANGIRVDTYWTWPESLRYYLAQKMWVARWKHDLGLVWEADLPPYDLRIDGDEARFTIEHEGRSRDLLCARRAGDRLILLEEPLYEELTRGDAGDHWTTAVFGTATLSLALALRGWPLIRSEELWDEISGCDIGGPEGLAYKLQVWEAVARRDGWSVPTPRLPGLPYPSHEDLEALGEGTEELLDLLKARGMDVSGELRRHVWGCMDLDRLRRWRDRAAGAATLAEIFED